MITVTKQILVVVIMTAAFGTGLLVEGQTGEINRHTTNMVKRLETQTDRLKKSLITAFDRSRLNESPLKDDFTARLAVFGVVADRLGERAESNEMIVSDVENVLKQGLYLETMMKAHGTSPRATQDWAETRSTLDDLAQMHNIVWIWEVNKNPNWRKVSERRVFDRLKISAGEFRASFNAALDASQPDETELKNNANDSIKIFEETIDQLKNRVNRGENLSLSDIETLIGEAITVDKFVRMHKFSTDAHHDWARIKANLDELALKYNVIWRWTVPPVIPVGSRNRSHLSAV